MDGECLFCQSSVKYLYQIDSLQQLHFSTLQGKTAECLPDSWRATEDEKGNASGGVVLIENYQQTSEQRWRGADAVLRALYLIGGIWSVLWLLHLIPAFIKDPLYKLIARNRYRFTGGKQACELPSKEFSDRFVD